MPVEISDDEFDEVVTAAVEAVPPELSVYMENVAIFTQEWPTPAQHRGRRGTLLGLYEGVALTRRGPLSYRNVLPCLLYTSDAADEN